MNLLIVSSQHFSQISFHLCPSLGIAT